MRYFSSLLLAAAAVAMPVQYVSAAESAFPQFIESDGSSTFDIYQVFFYMKNAGLAKSGESVYLETPAVKDEVAPALVCYAPTFSKTTDRQNVWRLNIRTGNEFSLMSMTGFYFDFEDLEKGAMLNPVYENATAWTVEYQSDGTAALRGQQGYLTVSRDGDSYKFSYSDKVTDNARWLLERAYDQQKDMPRQSTADKHYVYTIQQPVTNYFLTGENEWIYARKGSSDSYWYFTYATNGSGRMKVQSEQTGKGLLYAAGNGYIDYGDPSETWLFYVNEPSSVGMFLTGSSRPEMDFDTTNLGVACAREADSYWVTGSQRIGTYSSWFGKFSGREYECMWYITELDDVAAQLNDAKKEAAETLKNYKTISPFAQQALDAAIAKIEQTQLADFDSFVDAKAYVTEVFETVEKNLPSMIVAEGNGRSVNLLNVRRSKHANKDRDGWFLTAAEGSDGSVKLNTKTAGRDGGIWFIEADGDNKFRLRNKSGLYIGKVSFGQNVAAVTDAASAGVFQLSLVDGYLAIWDGVNLLNGLNLDTNASDLVGYTYTDGGSTWTMKLAPAVPAYAKAPELTTDLNDKKLYVIRRASDPTKVLTGNYNMGSVNWGAIDQDSYWYFVPDANNDGVMVINESFGTCIGADKGYFAFCYRPENPYGTYSTFYWLPAPGEDTENPSSFILSNSVPADYVLSFVEQNHQIGLKEQGSYDDCALIFELTNGVDHEGIFKVAQEKSVAIVEAMMSSCPWSADLIKEAYDKVKSGTMIDWGENSQNAIGAMNYYLNQVISTVEENIETEAENNRVMFVNVRRENSGKAPYLALTENGINTIAEKDVEASVWTLEYALNGRFRLRNDNGQYVGAPASEIVAVDNAAEAGMYRIVFNSGYMTVVDHTDKTTGLNVDNSQGNLCSYSSGDSGSFWRVEKSSTVSSVGSIDADNVADGNVEVYNLQGVRVSSADLAPGVYVVRRGSVTSKIIVK